MAELNIIYIASEAAPLAKTGGLADVAGSLPRALQRLGHRLTVILPFYRRHLAAAGVAARPLNQTVEMWADGIPHYCPLHEALVDGLRFVLVEQDELFDRDGIYGPPGGAYEDNLLRYLLFNRVALEAADLLGGRVDILHCHDWQTGMLPLLLKTQYQHKQNIAKAKSVFTIHNLAYQGFFSADWIHRLGIPSHHFHAGDYECHGQINCMKAGIASSDQVIAVSPSYAREILTPEYGCGLDGFLRQHSDKISGIVNGLDTEALDPATDPALAANFSAENPKGKSRCKQALQRQCGLNEAADTPLLIMVSRLAEQKGIDLLLANLETWLARGYQLAILGAGEPQWAQALKAAAKAHAGRMFFYAGFDETLARQLYGGGDILLMPSRFEPCGLSQLMAMRYGTVPVVRATGGLKDTVIDYGTAKSRATGLHFSHATPEDFAAAVERAATLYRNPRIWPRLRSNALRRDSSWQASATAFADLYRQLLEQ